MKKKVLVIDDDPLILYGLRRALRKESLDVSAAPSAWLSEGPSNLCRYDLCLLDVHCPDYQCIMWLKFIKENCPATKVILMSASYFSEDELSIEVKQATANLPCHFIAKPFDLGEVKYIVRQTLSEDGFPASLRKFPRQPYSQELEITFSILNDGEVQRQHIGAISVDISEGCIGLVTTYPLRVSQIISFKIDRVGKTGIVIGSTLQNDGAFLARVRFT